MFRILPKNIAIPRSNLLLFDLFHTSQTLSVLAPTLHMLIFTRDSCTGRYCWERVLAMAILSVRLGCHDQVPNQAQVIETPGLHHMVAWVSSF